MKPHYLRQKRPEFGAVVCTIPMRGQSISSTTQRVVTRGIYPATTSDLTDPGVLAYLASLDGWLQDQINDPSITADGITITAFSRALGVGSLSPATPGGGAAYVPMPVGQDYDSTLTNELVEGSIADWMRAQGVKAQQQRLTYTCTIDSGDGSSSDGSVSAAITRHIDRTATNAGTGVGLASQEYENITSYSAGDAVPAGFAQAYYNALNALQYSGTITQVEQEASGLAQLGQVINLTGSNNGAWATMKALVVGEAVDVDAGVTTLTVGPPEHLSPQDMVNRLRIARPEMTGGRTSATSPAVNSTDNSGTRTTGEPASGGSVPLGVSQPVHVVSGAGGAQSMQQGFTLQATDGQIRVTTSNLNGDTPSGFSPGDDPPYLLDATPGNIIYACVTFDVSNGYAASVTSRTLGSASGVPADDPVNAIFNYRIGSIGATGIPVNDAYGPLYVTCFRLWFTSPILFGCQWISNGTINQSYSPDAG